MATISFMRVQHRCGTCDAIFGSMNELCEHENAHVKDQSSLSETDDPDFDVANRFDDASKWMRARSREGRGNIQQSRASG